MKKNSFNMLISFLCIIIHTQTHAIHTAQDLAILNTMSIDEKIGQLFMVAASATPNIQSSASQYTEAEIMMLIEQYHIGGIIYLGRSKPEQQLAMTQRLKAFNNQHNKIEFWVGLDAEWGPAMRLDNTIKFPYNLTLGAIQDDSLIQELGMLIGLQLKLLGISINFAPVADINTNPANPVINRRSFGQFPAKVAQKSCAYMLGLSEAGIMACAKHFPGHGDTDIDSHKGVTIINHDVHRIKTVELYPFKQLIRNGVPSVMVGHLVLPAFDDIMPATLSHMLTTKLLKKYCRFNGLVITDALDMHGVTNICSPGLIELHALQAGADILLVPVNAPKAIAVIKQAIIDSTISIEEIDAHVLNIIHAKSIYTHHEECLPNEIIYRLNAPEIEAFSKKLYQKAITIVRNTNNSIPFATTNDPVGLILVGLEDNCTFATTLRSSYTLYSYSISQSHSESEFAKSLSTTKETKTVIIGLAGLNYKTNDNYGVSTNTLTLLKELESHHKRIILVLFGNPYAITLFGQIPTLIEAYEDHPYAQTASAEVILGIIKGEGKLPIEV